MEMDQNPVNVLTPLPAKNIDTGLGLNRMACILQDKATVFETDQFAPLIELGEELSGRRYDEDFATDRALRVLADHGRAMTFLLADGVVPSNEDRGYVLRRIMRRAIQQGRGLGLEPGFLERYADVVTELMGSEYPELGEQRDTIRRWMASEEESFGRTLEQGLKRLDELIAQARDNDDEGIAAADAFLLHDTYGFPIDLTLEIVAEHGLGVDEEGFEVADGGPAHAGARGLARRSPRRRRRASGRRRCRAAPALPPSSSATRRPTPRRRSAPRSPTTATSWSSWSSRPFYATGGGQVADTGVLECESGDCRATVTDVIRLGTDQVVALDARARQRSSPASGSTPTSTAPRATPPSATTPPPTCCTRRCASAWAPTCTRPAPTSGPTSCASTSPTAAG